MRKMDIFITRRKSALLLLFALVGFAALIPARHTLIADAQTPSSVLTVELDFQPHNEISPAGSRDQGTITITVATNDQACEDARLIRNNLNVVILLDTSASMAAPLQEDGTTKFSASLRAIEAFYDQLTLNPGYLNHDQVAIVTLNDDPELLVPPTSDLVTLQNATITLNESEKVDYQVGLKVANEALQLFESSRYTSTVILVYSGGHYSSSNPTFDALADPTVLQELERFYRLYDDLHMALFDLADQPQGQIRQPTPWDAVYQPSSADELQQMTLDNMNLQRIIAGDILVRYDLDSTDLDLIPGSERPPASILLNHLEWTRDELKTGKSATFQFDVRLPEMTKTQYSTGRVEVSYENYCKDYPNFPQPIESITHNGPVITILDPTPPQTPSGTPTPTRTPTPTDTRTPTPHVVAQNPEDFEAVVVPVSITDPGGMFLGDGEIRVFAPVEMQPDEVSVIRVEIAITDIQPAATAMLQPSPTGTPNLPIGTPRPTPSDVPLIAGSFIAFYEYMGIQLGGIDLDNFTYYAYGMNEIREMKPGLDNWWEWSIRPVGRKAAGTNHLQVLIYLPLPEADTLEGAELLNTIDFTIEVAGDEDNPTGLIILVVGAGITSGMVVAFWIYRQLRRKTPSATVPPASRAYSQLPKAPYMFVSYSRHNKEFVDRLVADLEQSGFVLWRDTSDIPAGSSWDNQIQDALNGCTHVLLIITPESVASRNVSDEVSYAMDKGKTIIPLLVEDAEMPLRVYRTQYIDFRHDYRSALETLIAQLQPQTKT